MPFKPHPLTPHGRPSKPVALRGRNHPDTIARFHSAAGTGRLTLTAEGFGRVHGVTAYRQVREPTAAHPGTAQEVGRLSTPFELPFGVERRQVAFDVPLAGTTYLIVKADGDPGVTLRVQLDAR